VPPDSCIYRGIVMHHRKRPVDHRFTYRVFSLLLDIDRLDELAAGLWSLRIDRPWLTSFYRRDHGPRDGSGLRPWVEARLREAGVSAKPGRVLLLAMPRLLGFMFNPLSVYFCYDERDALAAIVYEVKNTFGGQHAYVLRAGAGEAAFSHDCAKDFYVSPFIDMTARYQFRLRAPGERLTMAIRETDGDGCFFVASHTAARLPLEDRALLGCVMGHSLLSLKVVAGIHLEALRLWLKGAPYFPREAVLGRARPNSGAD